MSSGNETYANIRYDTWYIKNSGAGAGQQSATFYRSFTGSWSKSGGENPYWRNQVSRVENAGTNFSGTKTAAFLTEGYARVDWEHRNSTFPTQPWYSCYCDESGIPGNPTGIPVLPSYSSTVQSQAAARFIQECRNVNQSLQAGVCLGELGETLRMIRHPLQGFRKGIDSYLGKVRNRAKGVKNLSTAKQIVAETWLEYSYGWKPFVSDVTSGIDAYQNIARKRSIITQYVSASAVEFIPAGTSFLTESGYQSCRWQHYTYTKQVRHVRYYGVCGVRVQDNGRPKVHDVLGFTLDNFVPTVYELIPWSFMVDYFSNMGSWLNALSYNTSSVRWVNSTSRLVAEAEHRYIPDIDAMVAAVGSGGGTNRNAHASGSPGRLIIQNKSVSRNAHPIVSVDLHFKIPGLSSQWANIAGLLAARKSSRSIFSRLG